jgi:hypothetical protein
MHGRRAARWGAAALAACSLRSGPARAGDGPATDAYEGIDETRAVSVGALADAYLQHVTGATRSTPATYRAFDPKSDTPDLALLRGTLAHAPGERPLGFRVDLGVGELASSFRRQDPAGASAPGLTSALSHVEQAFVTVAPARGKLAIDVGKFATPMGYEDNESPSNWSYSRSLLYLLAEPTFHTGARATWEPHDGVALGLFWLNGWNANVVDGSGMRSFAGAVSWKPSKKLSLALAYYGGLERSLLAPTSPGRAFRQLGCLTGTWSPAERIAFGLAADYGSDARPGAGSFWGVAGYARLEALAWLFLAARFEDVRDPAGAMTGQEQALVSATTTVEVRTKTGAVSWIGRIELRRDRSDVRPFPGNAAVQDSVAAAVIVEY